MFVSGVEADDHLGRGHAQALRAAIGATVSRFGLCRVLRQGQGAGKGGGYPGEKGFLQQGQADALGEHFRKVSLAARQVVLDPADDALIHVLLLLDVEVIVVQNADKLLLGHVKKLLLESYTQELPQIKHKNETLNNHKKKR